MNTKRILKEIVIKEKQRRQTILDQLPEKYSPLIKDVLVHMDNYQLNDEQVERKMQKLSEFRDSLSKENQISQSISKDIFSCLNEIDDKIHSREKFYYLHKILIRTSFHRFKFLVSHPHLFYIPSVRHNISQNLQHLVESIGVLPIEDLKKIYNFGEKEPKTLDIIAPIIETALKKILTKKNIPNYSSEIDQETKDEIIRVAQEQYPNVGNNKRMFFERPNQIKELDSQFDTYIGGLITDYMLDYLSYHLESYPSSTALFYDFFIILSIILDEGEVENIYIPFAQDYLNKLFARTHESKLSISKVQDTDREIDNRLKFNQSVQKVFPRKSIDADVLAVVNAFLQELDVDIHQEKEIRKLFLRRYRSKIEIRLYDLQEKYAVNLDHISPDLLTMLEEVGFIIVQEKKFSTVVDSPSVLPSPGVLSEPLVVEKTPVSEFDTLLNTIESLRWEDLIPVFEHYGYTVENPKQFVKQLMDIYTTKQQKIDFLVYLKNNIQQPEKRIGRNFWAIELKNGHRILILEKNIIDGIYTHDQYKNRIKSIV